MRFAIRYSPFNAALFTILGLTRRHAYVEVVDGRVRVRLGWAFRADFERALVTDVTRAPRVPLTAGAHGWRGRWLVNGAPEPIARITLREPARAFVLGVPVRLRELLVSVDDPDALRAELLAAATL